MQTISKLLAMTLLTLAAGCATDGSTSDDACGNGTCDPGETHASCDVDCAATGQNTCGDGTCSAGETHTSCAADCPASGGSNAVCGDGNCTGDETNATCAADCPASTAVCGDGQCDGTETSTGCPSDCAAATCTNNPDSCTGESICMQGSCVQAFGRVYKIVVSSGVMPQFDSTNATWDISGGAPDPYVQITLNGTDIAHTSYKSNTFTPTWGESTNATIPAGSTFKIGAWDADLPASPDNLMFDCLSSPLTADLLRASSLTCSGPMSSSFTFHFVAQ